MPRPRKPTRKANAELQQRDTVRGVLRRAKMPGCETVERGHNGDSQCKRTGWPVTRGKVCWRCRTVAAENP